MMQHQTPMSGACYGCLHHRPIAGNAHLSCRHPATAHAHQNALAAVISTMGNALPLAVCGLDVVFEAYGIAQGWASWPYNFDPAWLVRCDGYQPAEEAA